MPADVAVHEPGTRVVGLEGHDEVAGGGKHSSISSGRVGGVEGDGAGVGAGALSQDEEVVTVKVDGVRDGQSGLDDEVDPLVCLGELDNSIIGLPAGGAVDDLEERRVGPVDEHGGAVEVPLEETSGVLADGGGLEVVPVGVIDRLGEVGDEVVGLIVARVGVVVGRGGGGADGAGVGDDTLDVVGAVVVRAGSLGDGAHPEVVGGVGLVGSDDDVVALAHAHVEDGGGVGRDGDKVGSDDSHGVVVNHELPVGVDGSVDESHAVGGTGGPGHVEAGTGLGGVAVIAVDVGAVDETVVESRGTGGLGGGVELIDGLVVPVVQEDHAEVLIVVGSGGTVDDDTTEDTLPGLEGEVGVVPGGPVLGGPPGVGHGVVGRQRALGDGADTIGLVGVVLANAVEVNAGTVVGGSQGVGDVNGDSVTPVSEQGGTGDRAVDGHGRAGDTIGRDGDVGELEPVLAGDARVGDGVHVVGAGVVVAPLRTSAGSVATASRTRVELGREGRVHSGREGRGQAGEGSGHEERLEHCEGV